MLGVSYGCHNVRRLVKFPARNTAEILGFFQASRITTESVLTKVFYLSKANCMEFPGDLQCSIV
jgi:hypothetical protein